MNRAVLLVLGASLAISQMCPAQQPSDADLARRIVNDSARVQPGEVVMISGAIHNMSMVEALAIETMKVGGLPVTLVTSDRIERAHYVDVPEKYLDIPQTFFAEWLKTVDVSIDLPFVQDEKALFQGVPEERRARARRAMYAAVDALTNSPKVRSFSLTFPTAEAAEIVGVPLEQLAAVQWRAMNVDVKQLAKTAAAAKKLLAGANQVHITSPAGTDLTFSTGDRTILLDDGVIDAEELKSPLFASRYASFPPGEVVFTPIETSAVGRVVVPRSTCRFKPMTGVSFRFNKGKMEDFSAKSGGDCFEGIMATATGQKDVLGSIWIGLNPEDRVIDDGPANYRPWTAAGVVYLITGYNVQLGGTIKSDVQFPFPILNATVEVNGKPIIKDGKLLF